MPEALRRSTAPGEAAGHAHDRDRLGLPGLDQLQPMPGPPQVGSDQAQVFSELAFGTCHGENLRLRKDVVDRPGRALCPAALDIRRRSASDGYCDISETRSRGKAKMLAACN